MFTGELLYVRHDTRKTKPETKDTKIWVASVGTGVDSILFYVTLRYITLRFSLSCYGFMIFPISLFLRVCHLLRAAAFESLS